MNTDYVNRAKIRFMQKVRVSPFCWWWTACVNPNGYGWFSFNGAPMNSHRAAYMLFRGDPGDLLVRHTCDNRLCVNPEHLELGSYLDNMRDMTDRNRQAFGERNGRGRLSSSQVRDIRESSERYAMLAARHGISESHISGIKHGKFWKHPLCQ